MHFRLIILLFSFFSSSIAFSQTFDLNLNATMLQENGIWKKDSQITITKFVHKTTISPINHLINEIFYLQDNNGNQVNISKRMSNCFYFKYDNIQQFWDANIITDVLFSLKKNGFQYDLRQEMESDALNYIYKVKNNGLELNDPYLETYIYNLIAKIAPMRLIDGRPCSINLLIQQDPSINACCFPNGTIVLNTGLIAALHTEDELVAILAHEIAHFVLDHSIQNVNANIKRLKRAAFWAAIATGITATMEGYVASKNQYYTPGTATVSMAAISTAIALQVNEHLGMKYNHKQEDEADKLAIDVLKILGYNPNALASALSRIEEEYIKERNNTPYLTSYTHPALTERIKNTGAPKADKDQRFEQLISFAVSNIAIMKYTNRRFHQCLTYVNQNISNKVATTDDYILKAYCLLATKNDKESNQEVLNLIKIAKQLDSKNINIYKAEIIATLRLEDKIKALELMQQYVTILNAYNLAEIKSASTWDKLHNFIISEEEWVKQMSIKLNGM